MKNENKQDDMISISVVPVLSIGTKIISISIPVPVLELELELEQLLSKLELEMELKRNFVKYWN